MDFSELLLGHIQKFYIKNNDFVSMIFAITAGFVAMGALAISISDSLSTVIRGAATAGILVILLLTINIATKLGIKDNKKVIQIEKTIIANHDKISLFDNGKRHEVLNLIETIFSKKGKEEDLSSLLQILDEGAESTVDKSK